MAAVTNLPSSALMNDGRRAFGTSRGPLTSPTGTAASTENHTTKTPVPTPAKAPPSETSKLRKFSPEDFEVLDKVYVNGDSIVFKCRSKLDGRTLFAIKQRVTSELGKHADLLHETKLNLQHPHIVACCGAYWNPRHALNMVFEWADGGDLLSLIRQRKLRAKLISETEIWRWSSQLFSALDALHQRRIIHRDIKCSNLLLFSRADASNLCGNSVVGNDGQILGRMAAAAAASSWSPGRGSSARPSSASSSSSGSLASHYSRYPQQPSSFSSSQLPSPLEMPSLYDLKVTDLGVARKVKLPQKKKRHPHLAASASASSPRAAAVRGARANAHGADDTAGSTDEDEDDEPALGPTDFATTLFGTPLYMSPELVTNDPVSKGPKYTFKTDIWSAGVSIYEMAALSGPFAGQSMAALSNAVRSGRYKPLPAMYSSGLRQFIASLLQIDPLKRPDAAEALQICNEWLSRNRGPDSGLISVVGGLESRRTAAVAERREANGLRTSSPSSSPAPSRVAAMAPASKTAGAGANINGGGGSSGWDDYNYDTDRRLPRRGDEDMDMVQRARALNAASDAREEPPSPSPRGSSSGRGGTSSRQDRPSARPSSAPVSVATMHVSRAVAADRSAMDSGTGGHARMQQQAQGDDEDDGEDDDGTVDEQRDSHRDGRFPQSLQQQPGKVRFVKVGRKHRNGGGGSGGRGGVSHTDSARDQYGAQHGAESHGGRGRSSNKANNAQAHAGLRRIDEASEDEDDGRGDEEVDRVRLPVPGPEMQRPTSAAYASNNKLQRLSAPSHLQQSHFEQHQPRSPRQPVPPAAPVRDPQPSPSPRTRDGERRPAPPAASSSSSSSSAAAASGRAFPFTTPSAPPYSMEWLPVNTRANKADLYLADMMSLPIGGARRSCGAGDGKDDDTSGSVGAGGRAQTRGSAPARGADDPVRAMQQHPVRSPRPPCHVYPSTGQRFSTQMPVAVTASRKEHFWDVDEGEDGDNTGDGSDSPGVSGGGRAAHASGSNSRPSTRTTAGADARYGRQPPPAYASQPAAAASPAPAGLGADRRDREEQRALQADRNKERWRQEMKSMAGSVA